MGMRVHICCQASVDRGWNVIRGEASKCSLTVRADCNVGGPMLVKCNGFCDGLSLCSCGRGDVDVMPYVSCAGANRCRSRCMVHKTGVRVVGVMDWFGQMLSARCSTFLICGLREREITFIWYPACGKSPATQGAVDPCL